MKHLSLTAAEAQLLVEIVEAAYRRQHTESAEVIACGDRRFHKEVTERLSLIADLLTKLASSAATALQNDPVPPLRRSVGLERDGR